MKLESLKGEMDMSASAEQVMEMSGKLSEFCPIWKVNNVELKLAEYLPLLEYKIFKSDTLKSFNSLKDFIQKYETKTNVEDIKLELNFALNKLKEEVAYKEAYERDL